MAAFGGYHDMPLMLGLRPVGALAWQPRRLSREVATAVSAQVSIAVARSIAIEASARIEAAREGERLRTALIDSLTHELRTPLTSIRAAATTLLQGEGLDEAARLDLVAHCRRGGGAARPADRRSRGDGRDRRQRGAGARCRRSIRARCSSRPWRSRARRSARTG